MIDTGTGIRMSSIGVALAAAAMPAAAMPPPVEVTPIVRSGEAQSGLQSTMAGLIQDMDRAGSFAAQPPPPDGIAAPCRLDDPERAACFAGAARDSAVGHVVFVLAEPAGERVRVTCIGPDAARSQQAELSVAIATAGDPQAALRERSALAGCIIGALHAPRRG